MSFAPCVLLQILTDRVPQCFQGLTRLPVNFKAHRLLLQAPLVFQRHGSKPLHALSRTALCKAVEHFLKVDQVILAGLLNCASM